MARPFFLFRGLSGAAGDQLHTRAGPGGRSSEAVNHPRVGGVGAPKCCLSVWRAPSARSTTSSLPLYSHLLLFLTILGSLVQIL